MFLSPLLVPDGQSTDMKPLDILDYTSSFGTFDPFPGGTSGKESAYDAGAARDTVLILGSGRSPREGNGTASSTLAWKATRQRSLWGFGPWTQLDTSACTHAHVRAHTHTHTRTVICAANQMDPKDIMFSEKS